MKHFLYVNQSAFSASRVVVQGDDIHIQLGNLKYTSIKIHSCYASSPTEYDGFVIRFINQSMSGSATDSKGTIGCMLNNTSTDTLATTFKYTTFDSNNPQYYVQSNTPYLELKFEDIDGDVVDPGDVDFGIVLELEVEG